MERVGRTQTRILSSTGARIENRPRLLTRNAIIRYTLVHNINIEYVLSRVRHLFHICAHVVITDECD